MLHRKIEKFIENHLKSDDDKILLIDGARQVGKSFIIRHVGKRLFKNYIEINMLDDLNGRRIFENVRTVENFYMQVSLLGGGVRLGTRSDTLIFIDEIQAYPHLLTMLKFLREDGRFTYIASGSQLGIALRETTSTPMGSVLTVRMYPLDFEEFLSAEGCAGFVIEVMRNAFRSRESLDESVHRTVMDHFRKYLLVGGLPAAVDEFVRSRDMAKVRDIHAMIHHDYQIDASKHGDDRKLKIRRIYDLIPSVLENRKKRMKMKDIEGKTGKTYRDYADEFDYLIAAGIALDVRAVANPVFPLVENSTKNLLKLYLNDVGLLSARLFGTNLQAVLSDSRSVNLGTLYECAVAQELRAHGHPLYYYDNRANGEVDYLVGDYDTLSVLPVEVKSGRDFTVHSALNKLTADPARGIREAIVLNNSGKVTRKGAVTYLPVYHAMFL